MEYREPPRIAATERRLDGVVDDPNPGLDCAASSSSGPSGSSIFLASPLAMLLATAAVAVVGYLITHAFPDPRSTGCITSPSISSGSSTSS